MSQLPAKRPLIMGILNITPDSFSGDGLLSSGDHTETVISVARAILEDGADILDVGGESSRPGAAPVSAEEEIRRVVPVIAAIRKFAPNIPIAIDTVKASVARAACAAGATMINDISGLSADGGMAELVADLGVTVILMHNGSDPALVTHDATLGGEYKAREASSSTEFVTKALKASLANAEAAGIAREKIVLDPGLGFGKTLDQNLALINHLDKIRALGHPVLVGPSRKSFIGRVLDLPVGERLEGTAAVVAAAVLRGAAIIRVHDVKFMARVARMAAAIAAR